ncbi:regulatory protein, luxR family [Paracoccus alcaliphilus]|uniref:Regulatory protein, luxR family n=1 Tax=Paracoccus alcaliphilus TaxID=34002 RepID=A0A1H8LSU9_9RHOB|nr:helix-turn-helix transcriptional regulator [Paracoccus alcaliphilus]WCR17249.1 helix-turn-helix transcriptional regulator [Paracoccus alcaliphilus]SEO08159.1 regulatory protein, luxR family [Paracoccus alcaliphilus]
MIPPQLAVAISRLIDATGSAEYGQSLDSLTRCATGHDGYSATVDRRALRSYLRGAYLLDPFYTACISGVAEGLWRMRDLAPDGFYDSQFAWSREVHPCISDKAGTLVEEVGFVLPLADGFSATYSLMRNRDGQLFGDDEFAALAGLTSIIAASLRQHWPSIRNQDSDTHTSRRDAELVFHQVFGAVLTPAQHAVTQLILRGHSSLSIAENLGITEGTVKIHRSNIYRRLGVSSQSELFQRFIEHLAE